MILNFKSNCKYAESIQCLRLYFGGWMGASGAYFGAILKNLDCKLTALNYHQKILFITLLAVAIYGILIVLDIWFMGDWINATFGPNPDLDIYRERSQAILDGKILYKDIDIESPPLINYLLVPPQIFGGADWMYQVWFSIFPLLTGICMYMVMMKWDDRQAFYAAIFAVVCPYAVVDATFGIQDEPIVAFFYLLPVIIFLAGYVRTSAVVGTIAAWVKMLQALIFPNLLIRMKNNKERLIGIIIGIVFSLVIMGPFMIASNQGIIDIFHYYFLTEGGNSSGGMSLINLLVRGGFDIPGIVGILITVIVLLVSYVLSYRWKLDIWRSAMLTTVLFLCVYPMIRLGYFIIPFTFFSLWAIRDKNVFFKLIVMYALLFIGQGIEADGIPFLSSTEGWMISFLFVLAGLLTMLDITRTCLKTKCFLDETPVEASS